MQPTAAELALLRERPHRTKLWLSIYRPQTVYACQVDSNPPLIYTIAPGLRVIPVENTSAGSYLSVESGMTMYVGSTAGAWDKGRIRVRSATSDTITVAENSDINWAGGDYLTIVRFFEIWPIFPRLVQDGEDVTFYKDYDIAYADQNKNLGSLICMGPHEATFLDPDSDEIQIYYSASGTYGVLSRTPLTYDWAFEGGIPTGSSLHTPGWVTYDTPGHYTTRLTVTDASGTYDSSYRHISVYDHPGEGANVPIMNWGINSLQGSREGGGYTASIWIRETIDALVDGMLVVVFAEDWYGATKISLGGNAPHRQSAIFVGYITAGSITYNYRDSMVEFEARSPTGIMEMMECFSVSVESKREANTHYWYQVTQMTIRKALYHYLRWHTTVLMTNDFEYAISIDPEIGYFDADRTSLLDAINSLVDGALAGSVVCDRQGKLWTEIEVSGVDSAATALPTSLSLSNTDWMNEPSIEERTLNELSYLEMGGILFDISKSIKGGRVTPLMACAPGSAPAYRGSTERKQGLALVSQSQLNALVGNLYAYRNSRYPEVTLQLAGNYRNFDIAPQEIAKITLVSNDTWRRLVWSAKAFAVHSMEWFFDPKSQVFLPTLHLAEVTDGVVVETMDIPVEPPSGGGEEPPPPEPPEPPTGGGVGVDTTFIPATGGYQWNAVKYITATSYGSVELIKTDRTDACGAYRAISAGTFTLTPILYSETSANGAMYAENEVLVSRVGGLSFAVDDVLEFDSAMTISGFTLVEGPAVTVTAAAGDIITCRFQRNGPDDYNADMYILGWIVS